MVSSPNGWVAASSVHGGRVGARMSCRESLLDDWAAPRLRFPRLPFATARAIFSPNALSHIGMDYTFLTSGIDDLHARQEGGQGEQPLPLGLKVLRGVFPLAGTHHFPWAVTHDPHPTPSAHLPPNHRLN